MTVTLGFSGGIQHSKDVPEAKRQELLSAISDAVSKVLAENHASGTGSINVGGTAGTFTVTAESPLPES